MQYVAFLRGINVGGNNKVPMKQLQGIFTKLGFEAVQTYINSGNVIFATSKQSQRKLEITIEQALHKQFNFPIKVVVKSYTEMSKLVKAIPNSWFSDTTRKYNVIFLRDAIDSKSILKQFKIKDAIEAVIYKPGVLLWSALTSDLTRSTMIKLAASPLYKEMTVRNLNTTQKVFTLMSK